MRRVRVASIQAATAGRPAREPIQLGLRLRGLSSILWRHKVALGAISLEPFRGACCFGGACDGAMLPIFARD
jgi:hypothetical protein